MQQKMIVNGIRPEHFQIGKRINAKRLKTLCKAQQLLTGNSLKTLSIKGDKVCDVSVRATRSSRHFGTVSQQL